MTAAAETEDLLCTDCYLDHFTTALLLRRCRHTCEVLCSSVCLSVREHISKTIRRNFTKFFMHVASGRGSVLP